MLRLSASLLLTRLHAALNRTLRRTAKQTNVELRVYSVSDSARVVQHKLHAERTTNPKNDCSALPESLELDFQTVTALAFALIPHHQFQEDEVPVELWKYRTPPLISQQTFSEMLVRVSKNLSGTPRRRIKCKSSPLPVRSDALSCLTVYQSAGSKHVQSGALSAQR